MTAPAPPFGRRRTRKPVDSLSGLLERVCELAGCEAGAAERQVPVEAILHAVGRRAYGPLLLAVGLFAISPATVVPGMTWFSAAVTFVIAIQMALGMEHPWLPRFVTQHEVSSGMLVKGARALRPWAARIDVLLKPRLTFLTAMPFINIIALFCVAAAIITVPLGFIPVAPLAPGLAIVFFGLGVTARDGLLLLLGMTALGVAGFLLFQIIR